MSNNFPNWFNGISENFKYVPENTKSVLQIGVFTGDATAWILDNRNIDFIDDVDIWGTNDDYNKEFFMLDGISAEKYYDERFAGNQKVNKHKMLSDLFFAQLDNSKEYDFIYVDGDHTATQTVLDVFNAFKFLKVGGVMAMDDYRWGIEKQKWETPKPAIDAFLDIAKDKIEVLHIEWQVWIKKTSN